GEGADTGIATFAAARRAGGFCGAARDEARAELPGLSLCGATATVAGGDAGCTGATTAGAVGAGAAGTTPRQAAPPAAGPALAAARRAGGFCGAARDEARAELPGLSLCGATATVAGGDAGCTGATTAGAVGAGAAGTTDGTAAARTLVTIAREAIGVFSGSLGRSIRERTTPAPAVAPIAVATKTTRAVPAKLDAGAK